jgi:hypothetical protein
VKAYDAHYDSYYQVYCGTARLPSPVSEQNNACCDTPYPFDNDKWPTEGQKIRADGTALNVTWHDHAHQHYNTSYQVCCNVEEGVPSPVNEYNDRCCGVGASAHFTAFEQTCCNPAQGVPSSRTYDYKTTDLVGDRCGSPGSNLTATSSHNYAWQGAHGHGNGNCAKVQCCGTADYHTDEEICCVQGAPAPFLNND